LSNAAFTDFTAWQTTTARTNTKFTPLEIPPEMNAKYEGVTEEIETILNGLMMLLGGIYPRLTTVSIVPENVACVAWQFLSGETAITNPKVERSLGERQLRNLAAPTLIFAASPLHSRSTK